MRIVRFVSGGKNYFGQQVDENRAKRIDGDIFSSFKVTSDELRIEKLLAPLVPADILCIGANYFAHIQESRAEVPANPLLFIKSSNTLNNPFDPILVPKRSSDIDFESELAIVIGKTARHVSKAQALNYVLGYTCANDVSARDWQHDKKLGSGQFCRGKSFDGFCPLGPAIVTTDEIPNPNALTLRGYLNGQVMQDGNTKDMMFDVPTLIESLSSTMTLRAGTVILTGTPSGVGFARKPPVWLKNGDKFIVEIEKIGRLENPVGTEN